MLREGQILVGPQFSEPMVIETVRADGIDTWVVGLVGKRTQQFRRVTLTRDDLQHIRILDQERRFDGDGHLLRLGIEAYRLGIAYEFDPYFALSVSRVDPLPHQLEAVYDYMLKLGRVSPGERAQGGEGQGTRSPEPKLGIHFWTRTT